MRRRYSLHELSSGSSAMSRIVCIIASAVWVLAGAAPSFAKRQPPATEPPAVITGIGYAPISAQSAPTDEERRLLAIRASQLAAIRNLDAQIYENGRAALRERVCQ